MANKRVGFEINADDRNASKVLRRLNARFNKLARPIDRLNRKLRANRRAVYNFAERFNKIGASFKSIGEKMSVGLSLPIAVAGAASIKASGDFEASMLRVKTLTQSTGLEFQKLESLAKHLGSTTAFSAKEAGDGMSFLAMAGFNSSQILDAMPGVLDLAAAAQLDLAETSDYASNILTGFGLKANKMGEVADQMSYAFTHSNQNLTELHGALSKAGGIAKGFGLDIKDVTSMTMGLADAGHKAETAGIAIGSGFSRVSKFSMDAFRGKANEVSKVLDRLKIRTDEFLNTSGTKRGEFKISGINFIDLLDRRGASADDYMKIWGQDPGKYLVGLRHQNEKLNKYLNGLSNSNGLTTQIADGYLSGSWGALKKLWSALEGLLIALGDSGLLKVFEALTLSLTNIFAWASKLHPNILTLTTVALGFVAILGPMATGVGGLVLAFSALAPILATCFALGIKFVAIGAGISALIFLGWRLYENWDIIVAKLSVLGEEVWAIFSSFHLALANGFIDAINDIKLKISKFISWLKETRLGEFISREFELDFNYTPEIAETYELPIHAYQEMQRSKKIPPPPVYEFESIKMPKFLNDIKFPKAMVEPLPPALSEQSIKWIPDFISEIFEEPKEPEPYKPEGIIEKSTVGFFSTQKEKIDITIQLQGATPETKIAAKSTRGSRVKLDTGRMVLQ